MSAPRLRLVDAVFTRGRPTPWRWRLLALCATVLLHGALAATLWRSRRSSEDEHAHLLSHVHAGAIREQDVDLLPPPPPPLPEARPPPPAVAVARSATHPVARRAEPVRPPPPAQAAAVVAREASPDSPVDLTGNTFVQGTASVYAGGVTMSSGTSTTAVHSRQVDPSAPPRTEAPSSLARPVELEEEDWSCPWPHEADAEQIDEQVALVQVDVDAEGRSESVTVLADPGFGFGRAAAECARRAHYRAAWDEAGHPVRSRTPPLRVRFTR